VGAGLQGSSIESLTSLALFLLYIEERLLEKRLVFRPGEYIIVERSEQQSPMAV
jgi:hypothetical protein